MRFLWLIEILIAFAVVHQCIGRDVPKKDQDNLVDPPPQKKLSPVIFGKCYF